MSNAEVVPIHRHPRDPISAIIQTTGSPPETILGALLMLAFLGEAEVCQELGISLVGHFQWRSNVFNDKGDCTECVWESDFAFVGAYGNAVTLFECDGLAYHGEQGPFVRDRIKDRAALDEGYDTVRFAAIEITSSPRMVYDYVGSVLGRLIARVAPAPQRGTP